MIYSNALCMYFHIIPFLMLLTVFQIQSFDEGSVPGSSKVDPGGAFCLKTQLHSNVQSPANYPSIVVASFVQANTCTSEKYQI